MLIKDEWFLLVIIFGLLGAIAAQIFRLLCWL
jgi:hypothetical protein